MPGSVNLALSPPHILRWQRRVARPLRLIVYARTPGGCRLSTVRGADVIAVVYRGRVVEQGSHEELMASPHGAYSKLVRHQLTRGAHSTVLGLKP